MLERFRHSGQEAVGLPALDRRRLALGIFSAVVDVCDSCRRYRYIGLCYGPPGVGKTLSARTYSRWDKVKQSDRWSAGPTETPLLDTVLYTPDVVNTPGNISSGIRFARDTLRDLARRPLRLESEQHLDAIRRRDQEHEAKLLTEHDWLSTLLPKLEPT